MPVHATHLMTAPRRCLYLVTGMLRRLASTTGTRLHSTKMRRVLYMFLAGCAAAASGVATYAINYQTNSWAAVILALINAALTSITLMGLRAKRT